MRIVVDINHPAHVHYFKNFIWEMERNGHDVMVTATEKDVAIKLLEYYKFNYLKLGSYGSSLIKKLINLPLIDLKLYNAIKNFDPDLFVGFGSIRAAHVSRMLHKNCILFEDTEGSKEQIMLYLPFTDAVCTPSCFRNDLGKGQIRFNGYMELAYLHPNYFTPNPAVLDEVGLSRDDTFIVMRFVSWTASHDVGQHGIRDKVGMVRELEKHGRVLITSEGQLPKVLEPYRIRIAPEKLHDLLYYATLYVGEGGTMATEAALLGTPSIYVSSLAYSMGNFLELEEKYAVLFRYTDAGNALGRAIELVSDSGIKAEWKRKREQLLRDKIDVTSFMLWFIENYPESRDVVRDNPRWQDRFR